MDLLTCALCGADTDDPILMDVHMLQHDERTGAATGENGELVNAVSNALRVLRANDRRYAIAVLKRETYHRMQGRPTDVVPVYDALMACGARAEADDLMHSWLWSQ